jgi:hypothetical protein
MNGDSGPVCGVTNAWRAPERPASIPLQLPDDLLALEQICKRLDRRAAPEGASDSTDSLPASLTFPRFALGNVSSILLAKSW